jgi:DNA-binding Xre family transcriptional regulator
MKKIFEGLNEGDLLGTVGRLLLENWEKFPNTIENMEPYSEEEIATSSLVGADDILAVEEWIDPDEQATMYRLLGIAKSNIKSILEEKGISIRKLSMDLGMAYANAHDLVNREDLADTKLGTLIQVADYLKVSIEDLFE